MEKSILEINNLSYAYDKTKVLDNVAFQCNRGEVLVIAGPNGSGKTTLIKLLFGLLDNKKGSINYSHGMVKKIQLITAFILQSEITVVDETLNGIDIEAKEVSKTLFRKLAEKDKLVIMCTHDLDLAEKLGNREILLYKGTVKDIVNLKEKDCNLTEIFKNLVGFKESDYEI